MTQLTIGPQAISAAERMYLCPGAARASADIPKGEAGPAAESGKIVHQAIQTILTGGTAPDTLTPREQFVTRYMVDQVLAEEGDDKPCFVAHDHPLTIRNKGQVIWHGFMDRVVVWPSRALIWEWKTGRARVSHAVENVQARIYAVGTNEFLAERGLEHLTVCILCAGETFGEWKTKADFNSDDIYLATDEARTIWDNAEAENAKRIPGKTQCRYCPAAGTHRCPESIETAALLKRTYSDEVLANPRAVGELYTLLKQIEPMGKKVTTALREMLDRGVDGTGYQLGKPGKTPELVDANSVFNEVATKLTADQFLKSVRISLPDLTDAYYRAAKERGEKITQAEAKGTVSGLLEDAGLLTYKPKAAPIVPVEDAP